MHRGYHRWFSHSLGRDMELLVFGHAGAHTYEDLRPGESSPPDLRHDA